MAESIAAIIYDFDGVILESTHIKTVAFELLYENSPHQAKFVQFHVENMGVSRFDKVAYFYEECLGRPATDEEMAQDTQRFSDLVMQRVLEAEFVPGARECLASCAGNRAQFVASATPQSELVDIATQLGLTHFFDRLWGSPTSKVEAINAVRADLDLVPEAVLFIGDAMSDYSAARSAGVGFIGRRSPDGPDFAGLDCPVVADLLGVLSYLEDR